MNRGSATGSVRARRSPTARARGAWRRGAAALLLPLLAGCISEAREQEIGDQVAIHLNAQLPLVKDPVVNTYVNRLGNLIARGSERPDVPYRFYVVNSPTVNAFAIPGGHVYINRGLIQRTRNVSELSAVLAHEIGHVAARHGARTLERRLRTGSVASLMYRVILGHEPSILDQTALQLGPTLWTASHSREAELEADRLAIPYLIRAGVDPQGIETFLTQLLREEAGSVDQPTMEWFSTHPMTSDRIARARTEIARDRPAPPRPLARNIPSYPEFLQRVRDLPTPLLLPHAVPVP
ncbi:MAG TPA: M48 family metallopeptidase [Longimicrobiaceae bacterium]